MTNTRVGTNIDSNAAGKSTSAITTVNVKDVVLLWVGVNSGAITADSLSSARITWSKLGTWAAPSPMAFQQSLFMGIVNSVGSDTITATYSSAIGSTLVQWTGAQFHTDTGLDWQVDNAQVGSGGSASAVTAMVLPTLTSTGTGRLGVGMMIPQFSGTNGATAGWTYPTADGFTDVWPYNLSVGSGAWTPAAGTSTSGRYLSAAAILVPASTTVSGALAGTTPKAGAALAGTVIDRGALAGTTPLPTAALIGSNRGALAGTTPTARGALVGAVPDVGGLAGVTPRVGGALTGRVVDVGTLAGSTTLPVSTLAGTHPAVGSLAGSVRLPVSTLRQGDRFPPGQWRSGTPTVTQEWRAGEDGVLLAAEWRAGAPTE